MTKVDEYIEKQPSPQKEILKKLRKIIMSTFPKLKEEHKLGVPFFEKYYLVSLKDHVNIGFAVTGLPKKDMDLYEGKGKYMRHIKIFSVEDIDEKKIKKLLKIAQKAKCEC